MKEEKKITSQFDNDPLLKLKSREVDLRAMENERKRDNDEAQIDLARARLMQQGQFELHHCLFFAHFPSESANSFSLINSNLPP